MPVQQLDRPGEEGDFHPEDILVKTEKGNLESRMQTADSSLPRRLRTVLMVVDDKTPYRMYAETLANYGDVAPLYEALEAGGYITRSRINNAAGYGSREAGTDKVVSNRDESRQPMKPREVARHDIDNHEFQELITEISTLLEERVGSDALEVMLRLEEATDPQGLLDILPMLSSDLEPYLGGRNTKKIISEIRKQLT